MIFVLRFFLSVKTGNIYLEQRSGRYLPAGQSEQFLDASAFFPVHQPLGGGSQIQSGDDVARVRQLGFHFFSGNVFDFVHNKFPFAFRFLKAFEGRSVHRSQSETLFLVLKQSRVIPPTGFRLRLPARMGLRTPSGRDRFFRSGQIPRVVFHRRRRSGSVGTVKKTR